MEENTGAYTTPYDTPFAKAFIRVDKTDAPCAHRDTGFLFEDASEYIENGHWTSETFAMYKDRTNKAKTLCLNACPVYNACAKAAKLIKITGSRHEKPVAEISGVIAGRLYGMSETARGRPRKEAVK